MGGAVVGTAPSSTVYEPLWWDSNSGQLFVRYDDGSSVQWVSANSIDASTLEGSFLPLSGGTVTGPTIFNDALTVAANTTSKFLVGGTSLGGHTRFEMNPTNPRNGTGALYSNKVGGTTTTDDPQQYSFIRLDHSGGSQYRHARWFTDVNSNVNGVWALLNQSNFATNNTVNGHVGFYSQQVRDSILTGGTSGCNAWSGIFELRSQTGLPSSQDGIMQTMEIDLFANGLDDHTPAIGRTVMSFVIGQDNAAGDPVEVTAGISFFRFSGHTGWYKNMILAAASFSIAALNTKAATQMAGANAIWLATGHTLALDTAGTGGAAKITLSSDGNNLILGTLPVAATSDADAASKGVPVRGVYRIGSALQVRTV
jgi:hypothetical protein